MIKAKKVKITAAIKSDVSYEVFNYFRSLLEMNCLEEHFVKTNLSLIKKAIEENILESYKKDYVIVLGKDLTYYIQTRKHALIILKICEVAVFIYQTKHIEVPRFITLETVDKRGLSLEKLEELKNSINIIFSKNLDVEKEIQFINRVKEYVSYYYIKHQDDEINKTSTFEANFIKQLRILTLVASKKKFWNIFLGNKLEYILEQKPDESTLILELDFPNYRAKKIKKKLLFFQKKGANLTFSETIRGKIPELCSFIAMIVLFFTIVTCRDYEIGNVLSSDNPNQTIFEDFSIKGHVCRNKNFLLSMAAMFLFSIVFGKFWNRHIEKKKKKMEMRNKELEIKNKKNE